MWLSHFNLRGNKDFNGKEVLKCIRMWITIFKMFIWEGTSSDILSKISFAALLMCYHKTEFPMVIII